MKPSDQFRAVVSWNAIPNQAGDSSTGTFAQALTWVSTEKAARDAAEALAAAELALGRVDVTYRIQTRTVVSA